MTDEYRTIETESLAETKVQGSRFIARSIPAMSKEQAEGILQQIRKQYHDASHHCYAYRVGTSGDLFRYNDDGEPSGTAGKPILAAIDRCELTNLVVVVTRYFGGTKLGTGGLVRAYGGAALEVLRRAEIVTKYETEPLVASFPHSQIGNVMQLVSRTGTEIKDTEYDEEVHLHLKVRKSLKESLVSELINSTGGNVRVK